jgi:RHS repeat-associated protein
MNSCEAYEESLKQMQRKGDNATDEEWRTHTVKHYMCIRQGIITESDAPDAAFDIVQEVFQLGVSTPETQSKEEIVREQLVALAERKECPAIESAHKEVQRGADPVTLFNGQFVHETEDIHINGAGMAFVFRRTYKNQVPFNGPLGFNWTHNLHIWLRVANQTIFRSTGDLREEAFTRHPKFGSGISDDFDYWIPPDGKDGVIFEAGNSFVLRLPNGVRYLFELDPAHSFLHRLQRIEDRHKNYLDLHYQDDLLQQVEVNHPARLIVFEYDHEGRICHIRDFTGREWCYAYDSFGDLIAVTSPATARYKSGLTVCYDYSSAFQTGELQHNLTRIIDATGQIYLENEYGTETGLLRFNRVVRQRQGGGEYRFEYEDLVEELDFDYPDEQRPLHQTILVERNGQAVRHVYNKFGNLLLMEQRILQDGLLRTLVEHYRYNRDGNVIASLSPEGVLTQRLFGRDHFVLKNGLTPNGEISTDTLNWHERQAFGRILATVQRDGYAGFGTFNLTQGRFGNFPDMINGIFPADMGKRENDIIVKYTYEPEYGQVRTVSDPRFTNSTDPDAISEHPRHQETLTEYVYDGPPSDQNRFLVEIRRPTPTSPDGVQGTPVIEEFQNADGTPAYDSRGRLLRHINPVGVATEYTYFPEDPNDPKEGHLQQTVVDPGGLGITAKYEVDELGRVVATHLPRSVTVTDDRFVTRTEYNDLDQVVQTTTSKPFEFKTYPFYDRNGKLEREERELKDESGNDILGGVGVSTFCYDEEFNLIRETMGGVDLSAHLVTKHRYDATGQRVQTTLPEGNQIWFRYDERLLPVAQTRGACTADAATTRTQYDGDGRIRRIIDARGNALTFTLDAFGRAVTAVNALGHIVRRDYDKLGNITVERAFERRTDGYYLLARSESDYDELGRAIRTAVNRFDQPPGPRQVNQLETAFLTEPVPGSSLLSTQTFYDAQGRVTRIIDTMQREITYEYDNLDRLRVETDPMGNRMINHYDQHGNLTRTDRIDLERDLNNPDNVTGQRVYSGSFTYDELDRTVSSTDSLGNVTRLFQDSRDNQVRQIDPLGNMVKWNYDIFNRRVAERHELSETGLGGSPLMDEAIDRFEYDRNGNLVGVIDALDRRTQYRYDARDRRRAIIYPDESEFLFDYDPDGNLIRTTDNNGLQRLYIVDALGRTTRVDVDKSGHSGIQVAGATFERYAYDGLDRPVVEENDFARCEVRYNSLGWPVEESMVFITPIAPLNTPFVIRREFNDMGALTALTYPNGRRLRFERDDLDRLTGVQNILKGTDYPGNPATPDVHDIVTGMEYAGRQRRRCRFGNGAVTTYHHDGAARLIEIDHASSTGPLLKIQYLFDAAGNVRVRHDITPPGSIGERFAYDSLYRLANEAQENIQTFDPATFAPSSDQIPDPIPNRQAAIDSLIGPFALPPAPHTYDYDLVGNRERERDGSQINYDVNALDQYIEIENLTTGVTTQPQYDANGNLKDESQRTFVYDSLNRLVQVAEAGIPIAEFFHDARGRRILELVNGNRTQLICDGANLIAEYRNGQLFAQYVHDDGVDRPLQITAEGSEHWYHTDLVGSVRVLSSPTGNEAATYRYAPFGVLATAPMDSPYNPLRYAARRLDGVLGTYDYRSRQYNPESGRFVQRDPIGMIDSTNVYIYVANNPLSSTDPTGFGRNERSSSDELVPLYFGSNKLVPRNVAEEQWNKDWQEAWAVAKRTVSEATEETSGSSNTTDSPNSLLNPTELVRWYTADDIAFARELGEEVATWTGVGVGKLARRVHIAGVHALSDPVALMMFTPEESLRLFKWARHMRSVGKTLTYVGYLELGGRGVVFADDLLSGNTIAATESGLRFLNTGGEIGSGIWGAAKFGPKGLLVGTAYTVGNFAGEQLVNDPEARNRHPVSWALYHIGAALGYTAGYIYTEAFRGNPTPSPNPDNLTIYGWGGL